MGIVVVADRLIGHLLKQPLGHRRQHDRPRLHDGEAQVRFGPKEKVGLRLADVMAQLKRHVSSIRDVGHARDQEATSCLPFTGVAIADPEVDGNHAVELKAQMQFQRLVVGGVGGPEHGTDDGEQRPVNATHRS